MALLNLFGFGAIIRTTTGANFDLGDWLCRMLGICA